MSEDMLSPSTLQYIGKTYNRLTVLLFVRNIGYSKYFLCRCVCGKELEVRIASLVSGNTKSCGCLRTESNIRKTKHGGAHDKLYRVWATMKDRCSNNNTKEYKHYGGKGVCVCETWKDYECFRSWALENGYNDGLSIDRINNDGNYEPDNCRWVTYREQSRNTSRNIFITFNNETLVLSDWANRIGVKPHTLYSRLFYAKWDIEEALTNGPNKATRHKPKR